MFPRPSVMALPIPKPVRSLRERWLEIRNSLVASAKFQRWAIRFPLTRAVARHNFRALFDLMAGFVYSQILFACVQLRVFDNLAAGPKSVPMLAAQCGLTEDALARLMKAAASLNLIERLTDGRYGLGQLGAALRGNPSLTLMIEHHAMLYADLADPVALLRGEVTETKLAAFWAYARNTFPAESNAKQVRAYSALMAESIELIAHEILDAYPLYRHRCLLDVGGGEGGFLAAAAGRNPNMGLMLFDLPAVADRAAARLEAIGVGARAEITKGDFFRDPLPRGADVVSFVRVLHDHDDARAAALLRKAHAALPKDGVILIAEPMSGAPGAEMAGDAYFGFYLAAMGSGRTRTADELSALLHQAGFSAVRLHPTHLPHLAHVLVAIA